MTVCACSLFDETVYSVYGTCLGIGAEKRMVIIGKRSKLKVIHAECYGFYILLNAEGEIVECLLDYLYINSICLSDYMAIAGSDETFSEVFLLIIIYID